MPGPTITARLVADASSWLRDMKRAEGSLKRLDTTTGTSSSSIGSRLDRTSKSFLSLSGVIRGALIGLPLAAFFRSAVRSADEAERAILRMENTIKGAPALAGETTKAFEALASKLQRTTKFSDEAVLGVESLLGQFHLTRTEILALTPAVVDLSAKMGIDLESAAKAVGKATAGNVAGLQRMGIILPKAAKGASQFDAVLKGLRQTAGGFAEREGKTLEGRIAIANNQFDEFKENLGRAVIPALSKLADIGAKAAEFMSKLPTPLIEIGLGAVAALGGIILLNKAFQATKRALSDVRRELNGLGAKFIKEGAEANVGGGLFRRGAKSAAGGTLGGAGGLGEVGGVSLVAGALPVLLVAASVAALGAAFVDAFKHRKNEVPDIAGPGGSRFRGQNLGFNATRPTPTPAFDARNPTPLPGFDASAPAKQAEAFARFKEDANASIASVINEVGTYGTAMETARTKTFTFANLSGKALQDWTENTLSSFENVDGILGDLSNKANLTSDDIIAAFRKQLDSLRDYDKGWDKLIARGAPEELLKQLQDMGLQGAPVVKALANASDTQFHRILVSMGLVHKESRDIATSVQTIGTAIAALPANKEVNLKLRETHIRNEQDAFGNPTRRGTSGPENKFIVNVYIGSKKVASEVATAIGTTASQRSRTS